MALSSMVRRALALSFRSPQIGVVISSSSCTTTTTDILCRRNQIRLTVTPQYFMGVSQIQQLSTTTTAMNMMRAEEEASASDKKNLIGALEGEIDKAPAEEEVGVRPPDGFPFEIQDSDGSREVILQTRYGDDEQVRIVVDMASTEDGMEACLRRFTARATVTKLNNGEMLGFNIVVGRSWFGADAVDVRSSGSDECFGISDRPFGERLDSAFYKYLGARGIDNNSINFLFDYIAHKKKRASSIMFNKMKNLGPFILL